MTLWAGVTALALALIMAFVGGVMLSSRDKVMRLFGLLFIGAALWLFVAAVST